MRLYVVDTSYTPTGDSLKIMAHPIGHDGWVNKLSSSYLHEGSQPGDGFIIGFWHPQSKKRLKRWVQSNINIVKKYRAELKKLGAKNELCRSANLIVTTITEKGDAAEVSLVHRRLD